MSRSIKNVLRAVKRRIDPSEKGRVRRLIDDPPAIQEDLIVFTSSEDYTGNPKALFLYMVENGYNNRYKMIWLFEKRENYRTFDMPNVESICMFNEEGVRTYAAQKAVMSARYIFYSHNVNWAKKFREGQTFVDLWHGCGYKGDQKSDHRKIYYDYLMVTGKKYIDIFRDVLKDPDGNILDLGYPRNEFFTSSRSRAADVMKEIKAAAGSERSIIWMPTFRKSTVSRLDADTGVGDTGLPVIYNEEDLLRADKCCRDAKVLLIIKRHLLQSTYVVPDEGFTNILFIDEKYLRDRDADSYELMAKTDALLTDYSSVAIDYMLLDKPMGYTLDDFSQYEDARGWSFDNVKEYMPGHHIYNMDDLEKFIKDVADGADPFRDRRNEILGDVQTYRDGFSKRILDYFGI